MELVVTVFEVALFNADGLPRGARAIAAFLAFGITATGAGYAYVIAAGALRMLQR